MFRFVRGNLFESQAQTLVSTVNCVGIMGKGVAKVFKDRFPKMFEEYRSQCERDEIKPGVLKLYKDPHRWVLNFPTKRHWRNPSRLDDIEAGLQTLAASYRELGITSLAMPALGCGNGGLSWRQVRPLIEQHLGALDIEVEIFEPTDEADGSIPSSLVPDATGSEYDLVSKPGPAIGTGLDMFGEPLLTTKPRANKKRAVPNKPARRKKPTAAKRKQKAQAAS